MKLRCMHSLFIIYNYLLSCFIAFGLAAFPIFASSLTFYLLVSAVQLSRNGRLFSVYLQTARYLSAIGMARGRYPRKTLIGWVMHVIDY